MKFQFDLSVVEEITREGGKTGFWCRYCVCIRIGKRSVIRNREELSAGSPLRPSPRFHSSQAPCFLIPAPNLICTTLKAAGGPGSSPRRETFLDRPWLHLWTASATFPSPGGSEGLLPPKQPCSQALGPLWRQAGAAGGGRGPAATPLRRRARFDCGSYSGFPWEGAWRRDHPQGASR